jgi:hypothetical protein
VSFSITSNSIITPIIIIVAGWHNTVISPQFYGFPDCCQIAATRTFEQQKGRWANTKDLLVANTFQIRSLWLRHRPWRILVNDVSVKGDNLIPFFLCYK